ncbi:MAG: penicillin-binding transpeptidase domain-containing protein [Lentisphaerota bacterium]
MILGGGEVTLLDLANAYACLARGGEYLPYSFLEHMPTLESQSVFSTEAAYMVHDILSSDDRAMELQGHQADARMPKFAWKTGTSAGFKDAWTIAYNPEYVVGVWIGNPDGQPLPSLTGGAAAAPIACEIFRRLYPTGEGPWFELPGGLNERWVCAVSGNLPGPSCKEVMEDLCIPGVSRCDLCQENHDRTQRSMDQKANAAKPVEITSPVSGETYALLPGWNTLHQELPLSARSQDQGKLFWFVNGRLFREGQSGEPVYWPLQKGRWTLACSDPQGHTASTTITVE